MRMRQQQLKKIIKKFCSNSNEQDYSNVIDLILERTTEDAEGHSHEYDYSRQPEYDKQNLPKSIIQTFKQLYSQLELEITSLVEEVRLNHQINNDGFIHQPQRDCYQLLSLLDKNDLDLLLSGLTMSAIASMNNGQNATPKTENKTEDNNVNPVVQETLPSYEDLEIVNFKSFSNTNQVLPKHKPPAQKLEFEFIETISIVPNNVKDHTFNKIDVSVQVNPEELDFNHEEIEVIRAITCSFDENGTKSNFESPLWTDSSTTNPSNVTGSSELSTGQINEQKAVWVLAHHGNRVAIYNTNRDGAIENVPVQSSMLTGIHGSLKTISLKSDKSPQISLNTRNNSKNIGANNLAKDDNREEEEDEEQSTLNQITPIPTILESSS